MIKTVHLSRQYLEEDSKSHFYLKESYLQAHFPLYLKYHEISKSKLPIKNADGIHVLHI
jgi:hypothetical protein